MKVISTGNHRDTGTGYAIINMVSFGSTLSRCGNHWCNGDIYGR